MPLRPGPRHERGFVARTDPRRSAWPTWVLLPVGMWLTFEYRWVLDDAFIYFRYAENFAQTGQLVFNVGEYVEGFTSPAWMVLLATTRALGLRFWHVALALSVGCFVLFFVLLVRTNEALSSRTGPATRLNLPAALLCTNYAVLSHFSSGMETPLVQVCGVAFAYLVVQPRSRLAQVVMGVAPVVRPELMLPFGVALAWTWWRCGRFPRLLGAVAAAVGGGWFVFRIVYYADVLPNTYYLKAESAWGRGLGYLLDTTTQYHLHLWLIALFATTAALAVRRRHAARLTERAVIWLGAGLVTVAVVRTGGDFVHYRYLAFPVCALLASFGGVAESVLPSASRAASARGTLVVALASVAMLAQYPALQLPAHPLLLGRNHLSTFDALTAFSHDEIEDAMRHRSIDSLAPERWDARPAPVVPARYAEAFQTAWCATAYDHMDAYAVHGLGLTSAVLARLNVPSGRQAGHKWKLRRYAADVLAVWTGRRRARGEQRVPLRFDPGRGGFRAAARRGRAPSWIGKQLDALEIIEAKSFNDHDPWRNVQVAGVRVRLEP